MFEITGDGPSFIKQFFSVILQLFNALFNVSQSSMTSVFLRSSFIDLRVPSLGQLLDGADINSPVVQPGREAGHVFINELPVLTHAVPRQRTLPGLGVFLQHLQHLPLRLLAGHLALPAGLSQTTQSVLLHAPLVHRVQGLVLTVDDDALGLT